METKAPKRSVPQSSLITIRPYLGLHLYRFYDDQNFNGNLSEQLPCGKTNILSILPLT